jgi:uncharacterized repeat protein (TIGR03803 family)
MTTNSTLGSRVFLAVFSALILCGGHAAATAKLTTLHSFQPYLHGEGANDMVVDAAGNLYAVSRGGSYNSGMVYKLSPNSQGAWTQTVLYDFTGGSDGLTPMGLLLDASGKLYGLTAGGGASGFGVFFELIPSAAGPWKEHVLYSFPSQNSGIFNPGLAQDAAGNFYGTTWSDFGPNYGSLFQLTRSAGGSWTENVLHNFTNGADGGTPFCIPVFDSAGNLYGTTSAGGSAGLGVVFEFSPSSNGNWTETVLYNFTGGADGYQAQSLVLDAAGDLFGTTWYGGAASCTANGGCGTVFELMRGANNQWTKTTLHTFGASNLQQGLPTVYPSNVAIDAFGNLYGATAYGGNAACNGGCGNAYELERSADGQFAFLVIHGFTGGNDGWSPGGIVMGAGGQLYGGMARAITGSLGTFFELNFTGNRWKLTDIYDFYITDTASPLSNLIQDASGNFYGTGDFAGTYNLGGVYELTPDGKGGWKENLIYSFSSGFDNSVNGVDPSGLTLDSQGNLYGTAAFSGRAEYGSVFELSSQPGGGWQEKDLADFSGTVDHPFGGVIFDRSGNLYGTANEGGSSGLGAIFELTPAANGQWTQKVIYNFSGYPNDGASPAAGLIIDEAGNLYGTTQKGGSSQNCVGGAGLPIGCGAVFELSPAAPGGWKYQVLYSFQGSTIDGASPLASLVFDSSGNLYGTTAQGGTKGGCSQSNGPSTCGTVFELSPNGSSWNEKLLYEFTNAGGDGAVPAAAVTFDHAGNLFGTTSSGGAYGAGTVFKLTPEGGSWDESIVYSFGSNRFDGKYPEGSLILDSAGNLYGATVSGGQTQGGNLGWGGGGYGMVYEITP